jgi:hypothetical protein
MQELLQLDKLSKDLERIVRWGSHVALHRAILNTFPIKGILELGAGLYSTKEFFNRDVKVVSIESDNNWIRQLRPLLSVDEKHKIIYHALDKNITRRTRYAMASKSVRGEAIKFYSSFISDDMNLLFIDQYAAFRLDSLQSLYHKFDVVTFHDVEPPDTYMYSLFKNNENYIRFIDKTYLTHTGLLIKPCLESFIESFLESWKIETEKRSIELGVIAIPCIERYN